MWTFISSGSVGGHTTSGLRTERDAQLLLTTLASMIVPFSYGSSKRLYRNVTTINTSMMNATAEVLQFLPTVTVFSNDSYGLGIGSLPMDANNLADLHGPKRDPLYVVVPITIVYLVIFITGVIGNISTCIVIARNRSMHTATNYYLFSLAVSDFLLLVSGVPQEIYFIWSKYPYVFGETFCVLRGIAAETSANATVLTITAFTIERYVAICHPFLSHTMSKLSRAIRFIFVIWLIAIVSAVPQALQFGVTSQGGIDQCVVKRIIIQHSFELSTFLFFFAPMTLITVLYALIGLKLRSSTLMQRDGTLQRRNNLAGNSRQSTANSQGTRRVLKMLVAVVVAFFICWAPFHAQRLVYIYGVDKDHQPSDPLILQMFIVMTYISGILYYLSTCINPLLYNIMSNKFRQAFKETLANCSQIARQSNNAERSYRILPRRKRCSAANQESSDVSGNSIRDESLYSSSTQKQSFDSLTLSRGRSLKRAPSSAWAFAGPETVVMSASVALSTCYHHNPHHQLELHTHDPDLQQNIFSSADVGGTMTALCRGEEQNDEQQQQRLARVTIQVNRMHAESRLPFPAGSSGGFKSRHAGQRGGDSLSLFCRQPRGLDGRGEIFVHDRPRLRCRIPLWRFFQRLRWGNLADGQDPFDSEAATDQRSSLETSSVVQFCRPVGARQDKLERGARPSLHNEEDGCTVGSYGDAEPSFASGSCGNRSRYNGNPYNCVTVEDNLDEHMREIKLRETARR